MGFFHFTAKFLRNKTAYGYDVSGEVYEGSGPIAKEQNERDINEPQDHHETPKNPVNYVRDTEAEQEFPEQLEGAGQQKYLPVRQR